MQNNKKDIRAAMMKRRRNLDNGSVLALSDIIQKRIVESRFFKESSVIMAYMPIQNEIRTDLLIERSIASGKTILLPRIKDAETMEAVPIQSLGSDLIKGYMGIMEPDPSIPAANPQTIDLVILPGIAFDRKGYRIGFGGGYYDRFITRLRNDCILLAPAYDFQVLEHIPAEAFDQPVDMVVTEKEIIHISLK
jgi:5-formyltetrahydrofolate cyclo-ligase